MGDLESSPVCLSFNRHRRFQFRGATLTSDAGPLLPRAPGERFGLGALGGRHLTDRLSSLALGIALTLGLLSPVSAADQRTVGTVKIVAGAASVTREGQELPAREGLALVESDVLRTGPDGRLGVILQDDTRLSLGPESEIRIHRFVFAPAQGTLGLVLRMARGVATYVSGKIAALAPASVVFETPVGVVGVRGTTFAARIEPE